MITVPEDKTVKLGVQMNIPYFNIPSDQSEQVVQELIKLSQEEKMPIAIKLDGFTEWDNRPDLWNWFDPNKPGYNPDNKENVEWFDWTAEAAIKVSWRNWGGQARVRPAPNLGSEKYIEAKKAELGKLLSIIAAWYNNLPQDKKYLFAGVILDNELSLNINHYFYSDGNKYFDLCPEYNQACSKKANDDELTVKFPVDGSNGPSFNRKALGYAAVKSFNIKSSGTLIQQDIDDAVKRHAKILAETAKLYLPADKIIIHGMWNIASNPARGPSYHSVVTDIVIPGWTTYGWGLQGFLYGSRFPQSSAELKDAIKKNSLKLWGAVEWSAIEPADVTSTNTFSNWTNSLLGTLRSEGNKLIVVYNLHDIRDHRNIVVPAIKNIIEGAPVDPNFIGEEREDQFSFTSQAGECQSISTGGSKPVVNLAWGKLQKALGYRVSKIETGGDTDVLTPNLTEQTLTKDELKFSDPFVLPGRTYIYQVEAILPNVAKKPTLRTVINVGCAKDDSAVSCQPYQKIITDQTGKKSCIDKPCQERNSQVCATEDKCALVVRQGIQSCVAKVPNVSNYMASFGDELESSIASLCGSNLSSMGINLDSHFALCQQKALGDNGCLKSADLNELAGCIDRMADQAIAELTPGFSPSIVVTAAATESVPAAQGGVEVAPEELKRTAIEIYLQTADGEAKLPIEGDTIRFPTPKDENVIRVKVVFDKADKKGSREFYRTFKVRRRTSQTAASCNPNRAIDPATWQNEGMDCLSSDLAQRGQKWSCQGVYKFAYGENCPALETTAISHEPAYNEGCWEFMEDQCTGCGISRSVERYTCDGPFVNQTRIKPGSEGQKNDLCLTYISPTFFRYECTGCREARRVEKYCNGQIFIAQTGIEGIEECADRCQEEIRTSCEIEDLAYYCERDNVAVYKYKDNSCQIQFSTVECEDRGQVCHEGDCVDE